MERKNEIEGGNERREEEITDRGCGRERRKCWSERERERREGKKKTERT